MLKCLRMMDEKERRAGLYLSKTGAHLDLSKVMVVTFWGRSASLLVMFLVRIVEGNVGCNHIY